MSRLLAVGFLLLSVGVAVFSLVVNVFASDVVAASRIAEAGPGTWLNRTGAWQWDLLAALGLAGAVAGGLVTFACFRGRRREAVAWGVSWLAISGALSAMVWYASPNTGSGLIMAQLLGGAVLIAAIALFPKG